MTHGGAPGFDEGSVASDATVPATVDDEPVTVLDPDPQDAGTIAQRDGAGETDETDETVEIARRQPAFAAAAAAAPASFQPLQGLIERVPAAPSGLPSLPRSGSAFRVLDSLGSSMDALDVTANPLAPGSYLGVYHVNIGNGRFALRLASSRDLRTWRKIADLDAGGGAMGTLRAVSGGGFLLAYEAQRPTKPNGKTDTNVRLRFYRDGATLLSGRATEERTLPRRLSPSNEGTPNFRAVTWNGSLAKSRIVLGFHYLDHKPKLPVDRQANGTLSAGKWAVTAENGVDLALSRMGFHGNHGGRRQFSFPKGGKTWRVYEAQEHVNVTGSWRVFLYDVTGRRMKQLRVRTPGASRSFANPCVSVLASPSPAGGNALVVTMFIFGAGSGTGESGELVYYQDL
jgi:hypothetical protein